MKTKSDFKKININEYAFFKGVSITEAKYVFASIIFPTGWDCVKDEDQKNKYVTKTGSPKINTKDYVLTSSFDFSIHSNSLLDKKCQLEYLCDYYNKGISLNKLREHSQNKAFIKALKFTGKNSVINEIINSEQLLKIQKTWLFTNVYMVKNWSEKTINFIINNNWCESYLLEKGIQLIEIDNQKQNLKDYKIKK